MLRIIVTQLSWPMSVEAQTEYVFGRVHGVTWLVHKPKDRIKWMNKIQPLAFPTLIRSVMDTFTPTPSLIIVTRRSVPTSRKTQIFLPQRHSYYRISCSSSDSSNTVADDDNGTPQPNSVKPPTIPSSGAVEVRFRRRSRRQSRQERQGGGPSSASSMKFDRPESKASQTGPKKWEEMSISEKAMELYMGEKGLLFWLNKFAYASIFIMIGAWIVFRFVGPALNIYQLDSAPLSPTSLFKGSE